MYSNILVALDRSPAAEQVLPLVRFFARNLRIPVVLLHVLPGDTPRPLAPDLGEGEEMRLKEEPAAREYLASQVDALRAAGVEASAAVLEGDPEDRILADSLRDPGTVIAMTTHGRGGLSRWLLGSVTYHVLCGSRRPLVIVGSRSAAPPQEASLRELVVPLDGSTVAEQALAHVVALGRGLDLPVRLVRVTPAIADYTHLVAYPGVAFQRSPAEVDREAGEYLEGVAARLRQAGLTAVTTGLLHGDPAGALTEVARGTSETLMVIATHGRSGAARWWLGSVADRVIRHAEAPLFVVRAVKEGHGR